ncbi:hypothetical protein AB0O51_16630 [Streptomyces sp. NPDC090301]|uniref:hypothetical protein n=1 Tax=Streptomyces sp. NPDC090301 TaxID=3154975 RepID=UPI003445F7E2
MWQGPCPRGEPTHRAAGFAEALDVPDVPEALDVPAALDALDVPDEPTHRAGFAHVRDVPADCPRTWSPAARVLTYPGGC